MEGIHKMKRLFITLGLLVITTTSVRAQNPSFSSAFTILREAAGGNIFFDAYGQTANTDFTGTVAQIYAGENLFLGGEANTPHYGCNAGQAWVHAVTMYYSIDGGVTNSLPLPQIIDGDPDKFQQGTLTGMVEIANALAPGIHSIGIYFFGLSSHCVAGTLSVRLPVSGEFSASFEIVSGPRDIIAADDAAQRGYFGGWTNAALGGSGFGPWTNMTFTEDGAAGFFLNNAITGNVATRARAWGMYANEGGGGGDQIQIAAAFRELDEPLQVGQTLVIDFQHGGIQSGSLMQEPGPRTGGWVGFALREQMPVLFGDPDPFSAFGTFQNAMVAVGFKGGDTEYRAYDLNNTLGYYTGLGYTTNGVRVELTFTTSNNFTVKISDLGTGSNATVYGVTVGGPPDVLAIYNRNAEEADAFFNSIYIIDGINDSRAAEDDASDAVYLAGLADGMNGGFGFNPWSLGIVTNAGSAGTFLATNPPNTDLNAIASDGRAWGSYANDNPGGGVQAVSLYRYLTQTNMVPGQAFGAAFEHGGVSPINGSISLVMLGDQTFINDQEEVLTFRFSGGASTYSMIDDFGIFSTPVPWSDGGLRYHLNILHTNEVVFYALTIDTRGDSSGIYRFCGELESSPKAMRFGIVDVEQADVFLNYLYLTGKDILPLFEINVITGSPAMGIGFNSLSGWLYSLEKRTNMLFDDWQSVPDQVDIPGNGGLLILTNSPLGSEAYFRVNAQTNTP